MRDSLTSKFYSWRAPNWRDTRNEKADWGEKKLYQPAREDVPQSRGHGWGCTGTAAEMHSPNTGTRHCAGDGGVHAFTWPGATATQGFTTKNLSIFPSILTPNPRQQVHSVSQLIWKFWLTPSTELTNRLVYCPLWDPFTWENRGCLREEDACTALYVVHLNRERIDTVSGFMEGWESLRWKRRDINLSQSDLTAWGPAGHQK